MKKTRARCSWCSDDPAYIAYHDEEWGRPVRDPRGLFAMLNLEGMQAGLSWLTILKRRAGIMRAFCDFDPQSLLEMPEKKRISLLDNPEIIRNKLKVAAVFANAQAYITMVEGGQDFAEFIWGFAVLGKQRSRKAADIPVQTAESEAMSVALKKRGFKFVGPTICYAYMQAVGIVNDHEVGCWLVDS